jgi:caa(3)-type oxidase subunit IV
VGFAAIKATLVALYFMHLKFERKTLGIIVGSTLILGVILVSVGMAEHWLPRP